MDSRPASVTLSPSSPPRTSLKGKEKAIEPIEEDAAGSSGSESDDSETSGTSDSESEPDLDALLAKAKEAVRRRKEAKAQEEVILTLNDVSDDERPLPPLDPGDLPPAYFGQETSASKLVLDPDVQRLDKITSGIVLPAPPVPPPELTKSGKPLTKREKKALKTKTAGSDWYDLPAPSEADLPRMYREVEALRLRNQLDPKRFYKKEAGEGKGTKGLPKYFAIGTILPTPTPFNSGGGDNLPRSSRKRTLVDELVDDTEARNYAKRKFNDLQVVRGAKGKNTKLAKTKWHKF